MNKIKYDARMSEEKWNAILQKNQIARIIKREDIEYSTKKNLIDRLTEIEEYIGKANQPIVKDILESEFNV